ncbi:hypothetical protein VTO73DRAFT_10533 [Trametes versicolor]
MSSRPPVDEQLPPRPPLKYWERTDMVNLEVLIYGWHDTGALIRMHLPLMDRDPDRLHAATRGLIRDVKHSRNWRCEFCGRFSRESQVQTSTGLRADPPRMVMFIHNICDHDRKTCFRKLKAVYRYCARIDRRPPLPLPPPAPKPRNMVYPRAGSCVGCQKDSTLLGEQQRCERCNLSRYCSIKCQKDDWPRHRETCERICFVSYDTVPSEDISRSPSPAG